MFENHLYNIVNQLAQEHKSLWRIKQMYKKDAGDCAACKAFWDTMEVDKESHVAELRELVKSHI